MAGNLPSPKNILRGHKAQVHAAAFVRQNERLATGDAEGFVSLWDLTIMRPRAVWKAHEGAILGVRGWGDERIITQGRDYKLIVWQLGESDEERLTSKLPLEDASAERPQPWILYMLEVNTLNFCSFTSCSGDNSVDGNNLDGATEVLIAVPNTLASDAIDIFQIPSQTRIHTVKPDKDTGMAMSLGLLNLGGQLTLIAAFENGYASVQRLDANGNWVMTYRSQPHTQPILSLDIHPSHEFFLTSSADATLAKHPIPTSQQEIVPGFDPDNRIIEEIDETPPGPSGSSLLSAQLKGSAPNNTSKGPQTTLKEWEFPIKTVNTKHAGQQSLRVRSDGRIFATAGWDSNVRVYSCKTMKELAVLQHHKVGCYAIGFAQLISEPSDAFSKVERRPEGDGASLSTLIHKSGMSVKERRIHLAKTGHWIAAGAKDGRVSLWDIY